MQAQAQDQNKNITEDIKERLRSHLDLIREYETQLERLERLTASITSPKAQSFDSSPGGSTERDKMGLKVVRKIELEQELGGVLKRIRFEEAEINAIIQRLESAEERGILRLRYLDGEDWMDIANIMYRKQPDYRVNAQGYLKRAYNKHGEALAKLRETTDAPGASKTLSDGRTLPTEHKDE